MTGQGAGVECCSKRLTKDNKKQSTAFAWLRTYPKQNAHLEHQCQWGNSLQQACHRSKAGWRHVAPADGVT